MDVSVIMITYGHEKFIEEAINGVLMQDSNFSIELIIANDCSPDKTDQIIQSILKKHPKADRINYLNRDKNIGSMNNFISALKEAKSKYIALCEGDDYWTDPFKLQNQIQFLESNKDYSMTCHNAKIIYQNSNKKPINYSLNNFSKDINIHTILEKWEIPTASMVFRREYVISLPDWYSEIYSGDFSLALILNYYGKIRFFNNIMSVYRVDYFGSSASAIYRNKGFFVLNQHIKLLCHFNKYSKFKYSNIINKRIISIKKEIKFLELKEKGLFIAFFNMPFLFFKKTYNKINKII
jgi:glycosyltransferase involved in cell wall biosynthesis